MKKNLILIAAILFGFLVIVNSTKRLLMFRGTSQKVAQTEVRLEELKKENETLKRELEYKKSDDFAEGEIRDKLGLVKEGEIVVVVPKEMDNSQSTTDDRQAQMPNWKKWWELFFGEG